MGSTGSGRFSDYASEVSSTQTGGSSGGSSGEDQCEQAFSAGIEDVGEYELFVKTGKVPNVGEQLSLSLKGRVIAIDANGVSVGALPTKFNYLASCLKSGFQYVGVVTVSAASPAPRVDVDFVGLRP